MIYVKNTAENRNIINWLFDAKVPAAEYYETVNKQIRTVGYHWTFEAEQAVIKKLENKFGTASFEVE